MSTIATRAALIVHPSARRFLRHYVEMLVAMFGGMIVLGMPAVVALDAAGMTRAELRTGHPTLLWFGMAVVMTVPMVAWMRYRGHTWRPSLEMAASMILPTLGVLGAAVERHGRGHRHAPGHRARRDAPGHARRDAAAPRRVHRPPSPPRPARDHRVTVRLPGGPAEAGRARSAAACVAR
jgi:hypothetical protein